MNYQSRLRLDRELVAWHLKYQAYLQVPRNRNLLAQRTDGPCGFIYRLGRQRCPDHVQRGTLVSFFEEGLGHYMSFAKSHPVFRTVTVFDPAGTTGQYAAPRGQFLAECQYTFPGYTIEFWDNQHPPPFYTPQNHDADSFCQTWSLAWLNPNLQWRVSHVITTPDSRTRETQLYHIVSHILSLPGAPPQLVEGWHTFVAPNFSRFWLPDGARAPLVRSLF